MVVTMLMIALFVLSCCILAARNRPAFFVAALLLFQYSWMLASTLYIELNPGLLLVSTWSIAREVGATFALSLLLATFVLGTVVAVGAGNGRAGESARVSGLHKPASASPMLSRAILVAAVYQTIDALVSPNALSAGGNVRATYWSSSTLPLATQIDVAMPALLAISGACLTWGRESTKKQDGTAFATITLALLAAWLHGIEFTGFIYLSFSFLAVPLIRLFGHHKPRLAPLAKRSRRRAVLALAAIGVAAGVTKLHSFSNGQIYGEVVNTSLGRFMYRALGLQGEVFWRTYLDFAKSGVPSQAMRELSVLLMQADRDQSGIYALMQELVPSGAPQSGYTLSGGFPAILVYTFGFDLVTVVATLACGIGFGISCRLVLSEIRRESAIGVGAAWGMMFSLFQAFTMGGTLYLASTMFAACAITMSALWIHRSGHASSRGSSSTRGRELPSGGRASQ